jgi:two-component system, chemotaxis family, protein-glutamate methylesterase/glutaminase
MNSRERSFAVAAIAASAGGLPALQEILHALPADFPGAILIVQHLQPHRTSALAAILSRAGPLVVRQAVEGDPIRPGVALVAGPDRHLIAVAGPVVAFSDEPPVHFVRPSADLLFQSVARVFGPCALGAILSGMGQDGADGVRAIKAAGGRVLAQDEATSGSFGMPQAAAATGLVDEVLPLPLIAPALMRFARQCLAQ